MSPDLLSQMPEEMHAFVLGAQRHLSGVAERVTILQPGDTVVTGIAAIDTPGHTPGHLSFEIEGDGGLLLVADAIAVPAVYFPNPRWHFGFDAIPDLAGETRVALLDRAATDGIEMLGFHWPYPGIGTAERDGSGYRYVPTV
jgi:glyoxylase-like metal-dependent hydrolase (beta-lactamase superfamily II)